MAKTNALRILDKAKISYNTYEYDVPGGFLDGVAVAQSVGKPLHIVFKTLVTQGASCNYFVFVIPVAEELDLKRAAEAVGEKRVEMIKAADITKVTGYIKGGCSPIGMKKQFVTCFDESILPLDQVVCSAGKVGMQMELEPKALIDIVSGNIADLCKR